MRPRTVQDKIRNPLTPAWAFPVSPFPAWPLHSGCMRGARWLGAAGLVVATLAVGAAGGDSLWRALWPALVALTTIVLLKEAALGLACGVLAAALLLAGGDPVKALQLTLAEHLFPAMQGPWRIGALVFTLLLGSFAGILEKSGGFESLLRRMLADGKDGARRLLGGVYGIGLLCFFDGLASSLLSGRIARPLADRTGVSRERLAWVVDSTGSPVACVAFISTWIATQLSLIEQGLEDAPFQVEPYALFFQSVPANAYCLLTLLLVPLAIRTGYQPRVMRRYKARAAEENGTAPADAPKPWVVLVPLAVLVAGILGGFPLLAGERIDVLSVEGWKRAFSGDAGPYALVFGSLAGWIAAMACFPAKRRAGAASAALHGAGSLLPALVVLIMAWTLGSMFAALGTTGHIAALLSDGAPVGWLPLVVFLVGASMAFTTGSSWGTMGLLMPLALPATVLAASATGLAPEETRSLVAMVIGAVFGGATLGDHCSPFSDTTIVSALASGCKTVDHVVTQLPFATMAAIAACGAYALMAAGMASLLATAAAGLALTGWVWLLGRRCPPNR
jgi:tetracycline resistance efflux pump